VEPERCRLDEFERWTRVVLEHEREHLSRYMGDAAAFMSRDEREATLHEITDIDWCLALLTARGE
jgi:hypothetical protein